MPNKDQDSIDRTGTSRGELNSARRRVTRTSQGLQDYFFEIAKGNIPGHSSFRKFGENTDIDTASGFEYIWDGGGIYVPPTQARIHDLASTDVDDAGTVVSSGTATGGSLATLEDTGATFVADGVVASDLVFNDSNVEIGVVTSLTETIITMAGTMRSPATGLERDATANASGDAYRVVTIASTGVSSYWVEGLDSNFLEVSEFVVLNGTSNVATTKAYIRQYRARVFGPGSTGAEGTITATAQTDGTVTSQVINGNNQTMMAVYTIPADKTGYLVAWWGALSKKQSATITIELRLGTLAGLGYIRQRKSLTTTGTSDFRYNWPVAVPVPGGVDVWMEADSDANDVGVSGGFEIILVDEGF